jgi:hypothetical protein
VDIVFSGICCWVDARPPKTGKTVIVRNALGGGAHRGSLIPSHFAFIHAKRDEIDAQNWPVAWAGGDDNVLFYLTGDYLTFDPMPTGGAIDISFLPHVAARVSSDPICPAADELRHGFRDEPSSANVLALVEVPDGTPVYSAMNDKQAAFAAIRFPDAPVTITATPFPDSGGVRRSLRIIDPDAQVFVANVNMPEYLSGVGAPDDDHKYLFCEIFKPRLGSTTSAARRTDGSRVAATLSVAEAQASELDRVTLTALQRAAQRQMSDFLSTLAAGCTSSQWP